MILSPQIRSAASSDYRPGAERRGAGQGFTILEMLTVVVIISIIAGVSLPAIRGLSHGHAMTSAAQQLLDDMSLARRMAISGRTTVYVLFVPTNIYAVNVSGTASDASALHQLLGKSYTSYALYVDRSLGSQPGQNDPRYLTEWKTLPEGTLITPSKYNFNSLVNGALPQNRPFLAKPSAAFPLASSAPYGPLPCVAFDSSGALVVPGTGLPTGIDQVIPLAGGSIYYARDGNGSLLPLPPDIVEVPRGNGNSDTNYTRIRINWLTGRSRIEKPVIQ